MCGLKRVRTADTRIGLTCAIAASLAGTDPRSFGEQAESAMKRPLGGLLLGTYLRACGERYDRSAVGDKSPTRDSACSPQNQMHEPELNRPFVTSSP